jgi:hypothetical protein
MPYIKADDGRREALQRGEPALIAGELNYQIFYYVKHTPICAPIKNMELDVRGFVEQFLGAKPNYQRYNDMTGALVRCAKEIRRRLPLKSEIMLLDIMESYDDQIAKYEDLKLQENGDVE